MAKTPQTNDTQALYRITFRHDSDEYAGDPPRGANSVYVDATIDTKCPCCQQWRAAGSLGNIELGLGQPEVDVIGQSFTDFSQIPGYLKTVADELLQEAQAKPLAPHTLPPAPVSWFGFRLDFLDESDQDTVHMVLQRGLQGLTLRLVTKDEEANVKFDCAEAGHTTAGVDPDYRMTFYLLDAEGEPTGELLTVLYTDIVSLGVY